MRNIKNGLIMKITGFIAISFSIAGVDEKIKVNDIEPAIGFY